MCTTVAAGCLAAVAVALTLAGAWRSNSAIAAVQVRFDPPQQQHAAAAAGQNCSDVLTCFSI